MVVAHKTPPWTVLDSTGWIVSSLNLPKSDRPAYPRKCPPSGRV